MVVVVAAAAAAAAAVCCLLRKIFHLPFITMADRPAWYPALH